MPAARPWSSPAGRYRTSLAVRSASLGFAVQPGQVCRVYTNEVHPGWCGFSFGNADYDYAWLGSENQIDPWSSFRSTWRVRGAVTEPGPSIDLWSDEAGGAVIQLNAGDGIHVGDGPLRMTTRETARKPPGAGDVNVYVQDGQVVFQYNDGEQIRYRYLTLVPGQE
jgi:hypothetical protein